MKNFASASTAAIMLLTVCIFCPKVAQAQDIKIAQTQDIFYMVPFDGRTFHPYTSQQVDAQGNWKAWGWNGKTTTYWAANINPLPPVIKYPYSYIGSTFVPPTNEPVQYTETVAPDLEVWVTGNESDLIDIVWRKGLIWRDYIRNESYIVDADIQGNDQVIAVRTGRLDDLLNLYGIVRNNEGHVTHVDALRFWVRDGHNIRIAVSENEVLVTYGRNKDLRTRFCYTQERGWMRSPGNNRGGNTFPFCSQSVSSKRRP